MQKRVVLPGNLFVSKFERNLSILVHFVGKSLSRTISVSAEGAWHAAPPPPPEHGTKAPILRSTSAPVNLREIQRRTNAEDTQRCD